MLSGSVMAVESQFLYINLCANGLVTKALTEISQHLNNWYGFGGSVWWN